MSVSLSVSETEIERATTLMASGRNRVLVDLPSVARWGEFEKHLSHTDWHQAITYLVIRGLHTDRALAGLTAELAVVADHAYAFRQLDIVGRVGQLLSSLPLPRPLESIGRYYQALTLNRATRGDTGFANSLFERVAEDASFEYRARALLALGANCFTGGDHKGAMSFYREVTRLVTRNRMFDPVSLCGAGKMTAVIKGIHGDHRGAVDDLERMLPLARLAGSLKPQAYYDYLNTLAVELGEVGNLEQAQHVSQITIASPFAPAYPEVRATYNEIAEKQRRASRSVVVVSQQVAETTRVQPYPDNIRKLMHFPVSQSGNADRPNAPSGGPQARVLDFQEWKTMFKASSISGKLAREQRSQMTTGDKLIRLMDLISQDETDDKMIDSILEAVEQIVLNRRSENLE